MQHWHPQVKYLVQSDKSGIAEDAVSAVIPQAVIYIPFAELVDIEKEIERLEKEEEASGKRTWPVSTVC